MSRSSDMLDGLTVDQTQAATLTGPVLVLAGAGTEKTKSLTGGVAHRTAVRGIPAHRILAMTFTNKAAAEMRSRIRAALGEDGAPTWLGTFHGLGARQLRAEPEVAGLRPGFEQAPSKIAAGQRPHDLTELEAAALGLAKTLASGR